MPGLWAGLGGYDFFFYGPLPFWTTAALISPLCESCSVSNVIVAGAAFFWVLSGYTCFVFLSRHFGRIAALTGSLAYCVLPYHLLIDWYVRQALGEFAAYAFIPLMAYGVDAVRDNRTGKHWLSVGIAGMALCHLPTTLLAAHVFAFIVAFLAVDKLRRNDNAWRFLREAVFWSFLGVLLASFYWVPAIFLLDNVVSDFLYTDHFVATRWLFQFSKNQTAPSVGVNFLLSFLSVLPLIVLASTCSYRRNRIWIVLPTILFCFLNSELSHAIWEA